MTTINLQSSPIGNCSLEGYCILNIKFVIGMMEKGASGELHRRASHKLSAYGSLGLAERGEVRPCRAIVDRGRILTRARIVLSAGALFSVTCSLVSVQYSLSVVWRSTWPVTGNYDPSAVCPHCPCRHAASSTLSSLIPTCCPPVPPAPHQHGRHHHPTSPRARSQRRGGR